jgi:hypothetical protein
VQTITGVPTAIAAFVGRTPMGPVNQPVIVNSFGDFQRNFGGLDARSSVGYAVRDFFQNGGGQAVIVRLFNPATAVGAAITFTNGASSLVLRAANPGTWANGLTVLLDVNVSSEIPPQLGLPDASSVFNLTVTFGSVTETIRNLTLIESPRSDPGDASAQHARRIRPGDGECRRRHRRAAAGRLHLRSDDEDGRSGAGEDGPFQHLVHPAGFPRRYLG